MKLYLDDPIKRGFLDAGFSACGNYRKFGHAYVPRTNDGGNYCGHDPANPKLTLEKPAKRGKGGHPSVIGLTQDRLSGFFERPQLLPSLNAANGSATGRQMRSEARESVVVLLSAVVQHVCLASLRVGKPTPDGFLHFTVGYFIKITHMSESRVKRAFRYLSRAGIISVFERAELQDDGSYKGVAAIRCISEGFFQALGLLEALKHARKHRSRKLKAEAEARRKQEEADVTKTSQGRHRLMLNSLSNGMKGNGRRVKKSESQKQHDMEILRQITMRVAELYERHRDWSREKLYEVAEKQIVG